MMIRSWWDWMLQQDFESRWLVVGKGPTFELRERCNLQDYQTIGLNHVPRECAVDVAHVIDYEVLSECAPSVWIDRCGVLVMPYHPHVNFRPSRKTLAELVTQNEVLFRLSKQDRLLAYNLSTARGFRTDDSSPVVPVRYFSVEAVLNLLGMAGVKTIRTLGIDGGTRYAKEFSDLKPLENSQPSFNVQQPMLEKIAKTHRLDVQPLIP